MMNSIRKHSKIIKKRKFLKDFFKFQFDWSRILSAIKTMLIIGVGSIFIMIPSLANTFDNGQWILIGLCMTQDNTVGGTFTTMKMRLIGTLFGKIIRKFYFIKRYIRIVCSGSMWAYATYLAVGENSYKIFGMLIP